MTVVVRAYNSNIRGEARLELLFKECTLKFRRTSDYDGSFGFDWLRQGDTDDDGRNPAYKSIMPAGEYNKLLKEYEYFDQPWRKSHGAYAPTERYYVPWMTIMPGETAKLRMRLEVGRPSGEIKLKVTGGAASAISISEQTLPANKKGSYDYGTLTVTCQGTFSGNGAIEAWNHAELVGKVIIISNDKVKKVPIALVQCRVNAYQNVTEFKYVTRGLLNGEAQKRLINLLKQLYIVPEFIGPCELDLTIPIANNKFEGKRGPVFDTYFRTEPSRRIRTDKFIYTSEGQLAGMDTFEYLVHRLKTDIPRNDWEDIFKIFLFDAEGTVSGSAKEKLNTALVFGKSLTAGFSTTVHEIGHLLSLPHTFYESKMSEERDKPIYLLNEKSTENIMDYRGETDRDGDSRISFNHYQMKKVWSYLKSK